VRNTTNVEGPLLTAKPSRIQEAIDPGREGGVVREGQNDSALKVAIQNIVRVYKPKERCFRERALAAAGSLS